MIERLSAVLLWIPGLQRTDISLRCARDDNGEAEPRKVGPIEMPSPRRGAMARNEVVVRRHGADGALDQRADITQKPFEVFI